MQIIAILVGVVLFAAIAFYISRPLMQQRRVAGATDMASLEVQREAVYAQIRELDMDHATGKMNDEDYQRIRAELVAQAAAVLRQMDGAAQQPIVEPLPTAADDDVEALIAARRKAQPATASARSRDADLEAAIAARRKVPTPNTGDEGIEAAIAARRKSAAPKIEMVALSCPKCGKPINADDAFCARCGTALQPQAAR